MTTMMYTERDAMRAFAWDYRHSGLCVLPAHVEQKRPAVASWKPYQDRLPTTDEMDAWFRDGQALCVLTGAVSGNLEMIDFDGGGALYERWVRIVEKQAPGLFDCLVIERSQRGGFHVVYRCTEPVCGSLKLAQRRGEDGKFETLIETRSEGGLFLCAPSPGYLILQGSFTNLPVLSEEERDVLLWAAWSLNEYMPTPEPEPQSATSVCGGGGGAGGVRPGDDFAKRGNVRSVLAMHGWTLARLGENEYWRRPGKAVGTSATLRNMDGVPVLYVFSSNAAPFEPGKAYSPFGVYTLLEHGGDYSAAASSLRVQGYGSEPAIASVDLSAFSVRGATDGVAENDTEGAAGGEKPLLPNDPGPMPTELLRVPGFVSELMDFCTATAPYPNQVMSFCGAVALQSFLAARKVRDPGDNRTNLYMLGLAYSSAGKDWPRRVNTRLLHEIGLGSCVGDKFASGEGLQDALFLSPAMLFQTDEIDTMLQAISKSRDARHENLMGTLLTMYTSSASVYPMRRKAGKENPGAIDQPSLTIFGTAVPTHYYEALSARMLSNGFFARMIVLDAGPRGEGQEPTIRELPSRLVTTARWWASFQPGEREGNLCAVHPIPPVVPHTDEAKSLLIETRKAAEAEYSAAEAKSDEVGTTVWGRVSENTRKLALIYAVSENHAHPVIGRDAVAWASAFIQHQTRRMLFMAGQHVAEGEFDAMMNRTIKILHQWREKHGPKALMPAWELRRRLKQRPGDFKDITLELTERKIATFGTEGATTKPKSGYRLL